jgi:hypothetical protein
MANASIDEIRQLACCREVDHTHVASKRDALS